MSIPMEGGTLHWLREAARVIGWKPRPNPYCGPVCGMWAGKDWLTAQERQHARASHMRYVMATAKHQVKMLLCRTGGVCVGDWQPVIDPQPAHGDPAHLGWAIWCGHCGQVVGTTNETDLPERPSWMRWA